MKKIISKLFIAVLAFFVVGSVMAEEKNPGSITINNTVKGKTYGLFRIFDVTLTGSGEDAKVAYTIDSKWTAFFTGAGSKYIVADDKKDEDNQKLSSVVVNGVLKRINITDDNVVAFANDAQAFIGSGTKALEADYTVTGTGSAVTKDDLLLGYYLVFPYSATEIDDDYSDGSMVSLTTTVPTAEVNIKAKYPTITKTADDISVDVGQTVTYTITIKVPDTTGYVTYKYNVEDVMSAGLTFDGTNSINVYLGSVADDNKLTSFYSVDSTFTETNGFKLKFDILGGVAGKAFAKDDTILITYTATVNDAAINKVEVNKARLEYTNNPSGTDEFTPYEETYNYSTDIKVVKVDGEDETPLLGATFVLKNANKKYYKATMTNGKLTKVEWVDKIEDATSYTTGEDGIVTFSGIEDGTYYLEETAAPEGYNMLTEDVKVTVSNDEENVTSTTTIKTTSETVENFSGTVLPSTGGVGTKLFIIIGSIVALGAALIFVTNKRIAREFN